MDKNDAQSLAKTRWVAMHGFELQDDAWGRIFHQYSPPVILQAIKLTRHPAHGNSAQKFARFENELAHVQRKKIGALSI